MMRVVLWKELRELRTVWAAMAIIGFFLFIVMFLASMVAAIVMAVGPMASYVDDLQGGGSDQAALGQVVGRPRSGP